MRRGRISKVSKIISGIVIIGLLIVGSYIGLTFLLLPRVGGDQGTPLQITARWHDHKYIYHEAVITEVDQVKTLNSILNAGNSATKKVFVPFDPITTGVASIQLEVKFTDKSLNYLLQRNLIQVTDGFSASPIWAWRDSKGILSNVMTFLTDQTLSQISDTDPK